MTLAATVAVLVLFAFACGHVIGVLATQAWYEYRADELAGQALRDDEDTH